MRARSARCTARFVDGGIVGPPPRAVGKTRLYLSGHEATWVAGLFAGGVVDARVVSDASALKITYAAWSKGTAALLLAIYGVAQHYGVERGACRRVAGVAARAARPPGGRRAVGGAQGLALDR